MIPPKDAAALDEAIAKAAGLPRALLDAGMDQRVMKDQVLRTD